MMNRFCLTVPVLALLISAGQVQAQYTSDQPRSLRGVRTVNVVFAEPTNKIESRIREQLFAQATLELRKAGLRVVGVSGGRAPISSDVVLNIGYFVRTGLADGVTLRMDVEQRVTMPRTQEALNMVTWFYEAEGSAPSWRSDVSPMLQTGVDKFLSDWLDANGR